MGCRNTNVCTMKSIRRPGPRLLTAWTVALALFAGLFSVASMAAEGERAPITEETGRRLAEAARAYAEVTYVAAGEERQGMPYAWGGRTGLDGLEDGLAGGDDDGGVPEGVGVDASGLVVAALRDVLGEVRFFASAGGDVLWADATSALLYEWNTTAVDPQDARAGDMVFFGASGEDDAPTVDGVGVVTGTSGGRVDFVVASPGQGRVVHTFARIEGEYWQDNIVGVGRLALPGF